MLKTATWIKARNQRVNAGLLKVKTGGIIAPSWDTCLLRFMWGTEQERCSAMFVTTVRNAWYHLLVPYTKRTHKEEMSGVSTLGVLWAAIPKLKDVTQTPTCIRSSATMCLWLMRFSILQPKKGHLNPHLLAKLLSQSQPPAWTFLNCRQSKQHTDDFK